MNLPLSLYKSDQQKEAGSKSTSVPLTVTEWLQASCWTCLCCCLCLSFSICKHDLEMSWWKGQPSWKVFQLIRVYLRKTARNAATFLFELAFLSNLTQKSRAPQRDCQSKQVTTEVPKVAHYCTEALCQCPRSFLLRYCPFTNLWLGAHPIPSVPEIYIVTVCCFKITFCAAKSLQLAGCGKVTLCKFALRFCISCAGWICPAAWAPQLCQAQTNVPLLPQSGSLGLCVPRGFSLKWEGNHQKTGEVTIPSAAQAKKPEQGLAGCVNIHHWSAKLSGIKHSFKSNKEKALRDCPLKTGVGFTLPWVFQGWDGTAERSPGTWQTNEGYKGSEARLSRHWKTEICTWKLLWVQQGKSNRNANQQHLQTKGPLGKETPSPRPQSPADGSFTKNQEWGSPETSPELRQQRPH